MLINMYFFTDPSHPVSRISEAESASSGSFRSNLPRPQVSGKSDSSSAASSSTSGAKKPFKNYISDSSDDESDDNDDDLLAKCIQSGMPKSKSEPLDLKKKSLSRRRSKSKSPRNSGIIPGVRISQLKLITKTPEEPKSASPKTMTLELKSPNDNSMNGSKMAVNEMWTDLSPNPPMDLMDQKQPQNLMQPPQQPQVLVNKKIQSTSMEDSSMASSICSTLDSIQPPSMMNSLISMSEKPSLPNSPKVTHSW